MPSTVGDIDSLDADDAVRAMAVANNRAPESYKITRADVELLQAVVRGEDDLDRGMLAITALARLAGKLEALLPPVPDRPPAETT